MIDSRNPLRGSEPVGRRVASAALLALHLAYAGMTYGSETEGPTIFMEAYSVQGRTPHYRIEIFRDGSGTYTGYRLTKEAGPLTFKLEPQQVERILDNVTKIGFWELNTDSVLSGDSPMRGFESLHMVFRVSWKERRKEVRLGLRGGGGVQAYLHDAVEGEVNSAKWRCPLSDGGINVCDAERQMLDSMMRLNRKSKDSERK